MKYLLPLIIFLVIVGCQKEAFNVTDNPEESILNDPQLRSLINSVASHDGSVDNIIDNSDCFSIKFPFQIVVDGVSHQMSTEDDLSALATANTMIPVFPVTLTMCNYTDIEVSDMSEWQDYIVGCHTGMYFDDIITCVDIEYPIDLKLFDANNTQFQTITLQHDWDTYSTFAELDQSDLVTFQYPIKLRFQNGTLKTVASNEELKFEILRIIGICN